MGILNISEDSFYDGGKYNSIRNIIVQTQKMIEEGASFIDVGVASSKPGSSLINPEEEEIRLFPFLDSLIKEFSNTYFSVDTYNSSIAERSLDIGVSMINDISGGLIDSKILSVVGHHKVPYIMMHMKGTPKTMQNNVYYEGVVQEIYNFLKKQLEKASLAGINDVIIDPGFGFGKNKEHNFELIQNLSYLKTLNCPILIGLSRKSMIYKTLGFGPDQALNGTTVLNTLSLDRGAKILRVHDVREAKECIDLWSELQ
jgi:dihydropteroate synthase